MSDDEIRFFDMCIVSILSFQYHPGNDATRDPDSVAIARVFGVADLALQMRREYMKGIV